jgi:hypothetical protein
VAGHVDVRFYERGGREGPVADRLKQQYGSAVQISEELAEVPQPLACDPIHCGGEGLMRAGLEVYVGSAPCSSGIMMHSGTDESDKYALTAAHCFNEGDEVDHDGLFVGGIPGGGR